MNVNFTLARIRTTYGRKKMTQQRREREYSKSIEEYTFSNLKFEIQLLIIIRGY